MRCLADVVLVLVEELLECLERFLLLVDACALEELPALALRFLGCECALGIRLPNIEVQRHLSCESALLCAHARVLTMRGVTRCVLLNKPANIRLRNLSDTLAHS